MSLSCHHRAAASRERAKARERLTLRDPVIHDTSRRIRKVLMDYRRAIGPRPLPGRDGPV